MTRRTVETLWVVALVGFAGLNGARASAPQARASATPRLVSAPSPALFNRDAMQDGRLEALEARLAAVEARLATTEQQLAQARAQLAQTVPAFVMLRAAYDKHTHAYEKPYLGGAWNLPTLKAHLNDAGYLVHVINSAQIPSSPPQGTTGGPKN